jgi:hypothetical protein
LKDLLQELRDIVEPIDYARAFLSLKGLPFLLGCILETKAVLEIQLARIMHATSSCVRNHEVAETVFAHLEQAPALMAPCIDPKFQPSSSLQSITLFFLRALVTSDTATPSRVHSFAGPIVYVIDHCLQESNTPDLRETALALLVQLTVGTKKEQQCNIASQRLFGGAWSTARLDGRGSRLCANRAGILDQSHDPLGQSDARPRILTIARSLSRRRNTPFDLTWSSLQ